MQSAAIVDAMSLTARTEDSAIRLIAFQISRDERSTEC